MKALLFLVLLATSWAIVPPQTRPDCDGVQFFGSYASHFNTFVFGNFTGVNSDTEGRLFAGGSLSVENWAVGCRVYTTANCIEFGSVTCADIAALGDLQDFLVAGADLTATNLEVKTGNVVYGNEFHRGDGVTIVSDCSAYQRSTDVSDAQTFLENLSTRISALTPTGSVTNNYGQFTFSGNNEETTEVFSITVESLASANGIYFENIKPTASVFINVVGTGSWTFGNFGFLNEFAHTHVLWNFELTQLTFANVGWRGSVLAPFADIVDATGVIKGQTFAKSWITTGSVTMQQDEEPFIGCLPEDPPPPPSDEEICVDVFGEDASHFNTFVFENFECYNSDTEGRLAAGGNISVASYAIGCKVTAENDDTVNCINFGSVTCASLVADGVYDKSAVSGQNFKSVDLEVKTGNVVYGDSYDATRTTLVSDCAATLGSPIDFGAASDYLHGTSDCLSSQPKTGSVSYIGTELRLEGTMADREVFKIKGSKFENVRTFTITNIKDDATLIFNVNGKFLAVGGFGFSAGSTYNPRRAIFNFYEAEVLTLYNVDWRGSVLAPLANIHNPTGQINGQLFAKSWTAPRDGACMQQNDAQFEGCLPVCA